MGRVLASPQIFELSAILGDGGSLDSVTIRDAAGDLPRDRGIRRAVIGRLIVRRGLPGGYIFERDPLNLFSL